MAEAYDAQAASPVRNFEFRLKRLPYFLWQLGLFIVFMVLAVAAAAGGGGSDAAAAIGGLLWLVGTVAGFALAVGRFHDTGSSGWWSLLLLIPLVGLVVWLYLLFTPSAEASAIAQRRD